MLSKDVVFEFVTAAIMKPSIIWDITSCCPLIVNRHFGETCHFHPQGPRIRQVRNQGEAGSKQSYWLLS
jgi:hypothetical protein